MTDYSGEMDVIYGFYLSILGDDISRTLERIESNQPYYTTLVKILIGIVLRSDLNFCRVFDFQSSKFAYIT